MRGAGTAGRSSRRQPLRLSCCPGAGFAPGKRSVGIMGSRRLLIEGRVQRVGYRDWAVRTAKEWNVTGWVRNLSDGRVEIVAVGDDSAIDAFTDDCRTGPRAAQVSRVEATAMETPKVKGFTKRFTA